MKTVLLLTLMGMLATGTASAAPSLNSPLSAWNGEYLQQGQGAVYVRFFLENFHQTRSSREITNSVFMNIRSQATGHIYVLSQAPTDSTLDPILVWKIPAGNYTVEKLSINENTGITRTWVPIKKRPLFSVRYLMLSNLGQVHINPFQTKGLHTVFKATPNAFTNAGGSQTFMGVLEAYKGTLQKKLGGSKIMQESKDGFGSASEARTAFTMTRQISMLHQVDSSGTQQARKLMSATLSAQDSELRRCYMDQLDLVDGLKGSVNFKFQIASNNGSFQTLSYSGGSLNSPKAIECLTLALKKVQFPVTKSLGGRLAFQFSYDDNPGRAKFP